MSNSDDDKVYVGSTGTIIEVDFVDDISAATLIEIKARKPNGTILTWTATAVGSTKAQYIIPTADVLDVHGTWRLQPWATTPDWRLPGNTAQMRVYPAYG